MTWESDHQRFMGWGCVVKVGGCKTRVPLLRYNRNVQKHDPHETVPYISHKKLSSPAPTTTATAAARKPASL